MATKLAKTLLLFCSAALISSCSEKINNKLVVASNLKKLGIKEDNLHSIDSLLGSALINNWTAGATALVAKEGQVVYYKGFGFKDRENKALMFPGDLFRIASMTKPIVSVAALQLVEEGKLKLDDPVSKYIPQFKNAQVLDSFNESDTSYTTVPANKEITIRNLFTHTSGIGYGFADKRLKMIYEKNNIPDLATTQKLVLDSVMQKLGSLPLGVQPDSKFYYGLNTDVLGRVIEVASGKPLDSVLIKKIFEPLGMNDTHFFLPPQKTRRLATMYSETKEGRLIRTEPVQGKNSINFPIAGAKTYLSGGSGLVSNIDDYAKFIQMLLNKGSYAGKTILKPETIDTMTVNQIGNLIVGKANKFGLGLEIAMPDGVKNNAKVGKLSWAGAFNTMFWIDPERKSIAILMTQVYPAIHKKEFYSKFETLVNRALDEAPKKK
ncbi:beta-lactamase [Pseudopedobacter saltans DSM 12145]|uniref:Beta-lactamase n=1 Tax=Pseudopedobacter saltans (strain ATCC 51119 / DSM 12145 / JCM 21818 / CCUG 39354 / LMG 10337 / NBRC 100064 / NCIMB 13643) TaxID=762903 RepID=F0SF33_PSESL|nr:serine hydrolase domain-containing protein [Pseudopedobacter saltans]ADY54101.1 beta-lactamase [Pseudopedobacter saltans DSM 12145]